MQKNYLGEFEELVLLIVAAMDREAYGAAICQDINQRLQRPVQISAVHVALYRLEEKGMVRSKMGGATKERGGRRKRLFSITPNGISVLRDIKGVRERLWAVIPRLI